MVWQSSVYIWDNPPNLTLYNFWQLNQQWIKHYVTWMSLRLKHWHDQRLTCEARIQCVGSSMTVWLYRIHTSNGTRGISHLYVLMYHYHNIMLFLYYCWCMYKSSWTIYLCYIIIMTWDYIWCSNMWLWILLYGMSGLN